MPKQPAIARRKSRRSAIGRSTPRGFSDRCRYRFDRDRRAGYIRRCGGSLSEAQSLLVDGLIRAEWLALKTEHDAAVVQGRDRIDLMRVAAEHRRQVMLLNRDLERTITPPEPDRPPSLAEYLAGRGTEDEAA